MKSALIFVLVLLAAIFLLKGRSHYVAFGFNWTEGKPNFVFGQGKGWAFATREDSAAIDEMTNEAFYLYKKNHGLLEKK